MTLRFYAFLAIGVVVMLLAMLLGRRYYERIAIWKLVLLAAVVAVAGTLGGKVMFFIEKGYWDGGSFFGAVFLVPVAVALLAKLPFMPSKSIMDMCSLCGCAMLATLKLQCFISGCCYGRVLFKINATNIRFPSQIAELLNALVIMVVLLLVMRKGTWQGRIYPLYLLLYGGTRFILNLLRETKPFLLGLPAGNVWSLVAILIALIWLHFAPRQKGAVESEKEITV